nr:MAG TPA: hypothetical protein [Caudoviricetes sp.]
MWYKSVPQDLTFAKINVMLLLAAAQQASLHACSNAKAQF